LGKSTTTTAPVAGPDRAGGGRALGRALLLYTLAALVSLVGLVDAVYLTIGHLRGQSLRCTVTAGCDEVLGSPYATVGPVPLAALGAAAYFTVFSLSTLAAFGYRRMRLALRCLVALMFLTTLWLLYLQAFVIQHYCQYCLLSAAVTLILTGIILAEWLTQRINAVAMK
jgi:uncharacterized membrane protein